MNKQKDLPVNSLPFWNKKVKSSSQADLDGGKVCNILATSVKYDMCFSVTLFPSQIK